MILCFLVEPDAAPDQALGGPPWHRQPRIRLRTALHRTRLITVRAISHALLTDQLQQPWKVRLDPPRIVQMALLERPHGMQGTLETERPRARLSDPRRLRHEPPDQVGRQQMDRHLLAHHRRTLRDYPGIYNHRKMLPNQEVRRIHQQRSIPRCVSPTPPT